MIARYRLFLALLSSGLLLLAGGALLALPTQAAPAAGYLVYAATDSNIWRMAADGSGRQRLTNDGTANNPLWVPGRGQIVFSSARDGLKVDVGTQAVRLNQLYIMNGDGSNPHVISDGTGDDRFADSYDGGQRLVFLRNRNYWLVGGAVGYDVQVLTMRLDGTDVRGVGTLPTTPQVRYDAYPPRLSPDGRTLLLVKQAQGQNATLILMDLGAGGTNTITPEADTGANPGTVQYLWPRWTNDGRIVAVRRVYSSNPNDNQLLMLDRNGKNAQVLTAGFSYEALGSGFDVDWTNRVIFAARSPDLPGGQRPEEIYRIDLATGDYSDPLDSGHAPSWILDPTPLPTVPPTATVPGTTPSAGPSATVRSGGPTATTGPLPPASATPAKPLIATADPLFYGVWERMDRPVVDRRAVRSWTWGPEARTSGSSEPYAGQPGGTRLVQYFDKARMERMQPADGSAPFVTNGLLVVELMSGKVQVGDNQYEQRTPATSLIGGDGDANPAPSYALLGKVASLGGENRAADRTGQAISATLSTSGTIGLAPTTLSSKARAAQFIPQTAHNIPDVFWTFLNQKGTVYQQGAYKEDTLYDWVFTMGYPVTEAYWTKQSVGGKQLDVLVQAFQRQVLTYAPANEPQWQVQFGNVGQHYYTWRYGKNP